MKFIINTKDIVINSTKIDIILFWLILNFIENIHLFLNFCSFYKKFIHEYSAIAMSLTNNIELIKFCKRKIREKVLLFLKNIHKEHFVKAFRFESTNKSKHKCEQICVNNHYIAVVKRRLLTFNCVLFSKIKKFEKKLCYL